ncbi:VOC family protein [Aquidulcibacter sp.]|uniref:VOC family protein n=1 Tax=Aquidulcibacter sp. TaxID=2052990 RepID=UPI003917C62D
MPRSKAFYESLGFELIGDAAHYCRFRANLDGQGSQTLSISHSQGPIGHSCHVGFEFVPPEALDAYAALLQSRSLIPSEPPQDRGWLWRDVILHDLDGQEFLLLMRATISLTRRCGSGGDEKLCIPSPADFLLLPQNHAHRLIALHKGRANAGRF